MLNCHWRSKLNCDCPVEFRSYPDHRPFGFPHVIPKENATSFKVESVQEFAKKRVIELKPTLVHPPMPNWRGEKILGRTKHSIAKILTEENEERDQAVPNVLYDYRRRKLREGHSPFEVLYVTLLRMHPGDVVSLLGESTPLHRRVELITAQTTPVERVDLKAFGEDSER